MKITKLIPVLLLCNAAAIAQNMPADYDGVVKTLGKQGDFKDSVLKVNIPRNDMIKESLDWLDRYLGPVQ